MFEIALRIRREELEAAQQREVGDDSELDTAESQILAACEVLADAAVADFQFVCGGESPWPVDVRTDLSVFLEQCVGLLKALDEEVPSFRLEMYEQGIETVLAFERQDGLLHVRCEPLLPGGARRFGTRDETVDMDALVHAVNAVVTGFIACCRHLCPQVLARPEMADWRRTIEQLVSRLMGTEG